MNKLDLATIETDAGLMTLSLEEYDGKRQLVGRAGDVEEVIQPHEGYRAGDAGVAEALTDIRQMYDQTTWSLNVLVDWRDYAGEGR